MSDKQGLHVSGAKSDPTGVIEGVMNLTGVILAAGEGKRLGASVPKPLVEINGLPMLLHVIEKLRKICMDMPVDVVINPAHRKLFSQALKGIPDISFSHQEVPLGTAMALKCSLDSLNSDDDLIVMYADLVLISDDSLRRLAEEHSNSAASVTFLSGITRKKYPYALVERTKEGIITRLSERKEPDFPPPWEFYIGPIIIDSELARRFIDHIEPHPDTGEHYIPDLANIIMDNGYTISSVSTSNETEFLGVNKPEDLEFARKVISGS